MVKLSKRFRRGDSAEYVSFSPDNGGFDMSTGNGDDNGERHYLKYGPMQSRKWYQAVVTTSQSPTVPPEPLESSGEHKNTDTEDKQTEESYETIEETGTDTDEPDDVKQKVSSVTTSTTSKSHDSGHHKGKDSDVERGEGESTSHGRSHSDEEGYSNGSGGGDSGGSSSSSRRRRRQEKKSHSSSVDTPPEQHKESASGAISHGITGVTLLVSQVTQFYQMLLLPAPPIFPLIMMGLAVLFTMAMKVLLLVQSAMKNKVENKQVKHVIGWLSVSGWSFVCFFSSLSQGTNPGPLGMIGELPSIPGLPGGIPGAHGPGMPTAPSPTIPTTIPTTIGTTTAPPSSTFNAVAQVERTLEGGGPVLNFTIYIAKEDLASLGISPESINLGVVPEKETAGGVLSGKLNPKEAISGKLNPKEAISGKLPSGVPGILGGDKNITGGIPSIGGLLPGGGGNTSGFGIPPIPGISSSGNETMFPLPGMPETTSEDEKTTEKPIQ